MIHGLGLPIQAQNLVKAYQTSTHFLDIHHYITDRKLPSGSKAQNHIYAEALNYVVVNNFLFRIDERSRNLDRSFRNIYIIPSFPTREQHAHSVQNARSRFTKLNQSYSC